MHILTGVNMMSKELVLVNAEEDKLAKVVLGDVVGWKPATPQHALMAPDEQTVYITTDALPPFRASIVVLRVNDIDWDCGTAEVELLQIVALDVVGTPSDMPNVVQTDPSQPIMPWTRPLYLQTHAPTLRPHTDFLYVAHYTDDRLRGYRIRRDGTLDQCVLYSDRDLTRQTHGVSFNDAGTVGLGVGYDYDMGELRIHHADAVTGELRVTRTIRLGTTTKYGAFVHHAAWIDDRYAYLGAMQVGPTSRTLPGDELVGASVWLIDTELNTAECVIEPTFSELGEGMYRSPSDVAVAAGKLYVAEEDSWSAVPGMPGMPASYGRDGFVSIWDISDPAKPFFIKRLRPGHELPSDFRNAHTITATFDRDSVFVSSFVSDYLVRIDTTTDTVAKVYSAADGLAMFHGEFAVGRNG